MSAKALGFFLNRIEASYPNHVDNVNYYLGRYADVVRFGVPDGCEELANKIQPYFDKVKVYNIIQSYSVMHAENQRGKTVEVLEGVHFIHGDESAKGALACSIMQSSLGVVEALKSSNVTLDKVIALEKRNATSRGQYLTANHITLANLSGFKEFKSCMNVSGLSLAELGMHPNQYNILSNTLNTFEALVEFKNKPSLASMEVFEGLLKVLIGSIDSFETIDDFFKHVVSYQAIAFDLYAYLAEVKKVKLLAANHFLSEAYCFNDYAPAAFKRMQDLMIQVHGEVGNYDGLPICTAEVKELELAMKALGSANLP